MSKNTEESHVNVVRSVWRRLKKDIKDAIIRDLQPRKDVKGGSGAKGASTSAVRDSDIRHGR